MKIPDSMQEIAIQWAIERLGAIIADDTGFGKTIEGIEVAKRTRTPGNWRGLVVAPNQSKAQWARMIEDQDPDVGIYILGHLPYDFSQFAGPNWFIIGYSELLYHPLMFHICSVIWDIVIVDEAHRIKNRKAKQTSSVKSIPRARAVCLTATPMEKNPIDLWSLLNFVRPDVFVSVWPFITQWVITEKDWLDHWVYLGPKDPEEFGRMMSNYMIRRQLEMPYENDINEVIVSMTERQQKAYDTVKEEKDLLVTVEDQELLIPNALALLTRLQQISTHPPLLNLGIKSGKMEWLMEFREDHPDDDLLVFTRFRDAAAYAAAMIDGDLVIGGQGDGQRFINGEKRACVGTIDAMGESLDGFQRARYAIFLDAHWSTIKMTQAIGRIFRRGILENKITYLLYACHEDKLVLDALDKKWTEAELVYYFLHGE